MTAEYEPECHGACLRAYEIGLPGYGAAIAYAHPDCEAHGSGERVRD